MGTKARAKRTCKLNGAMVHVLNALKAQIISGELSPGEQLRQEEMAEKLQVSRVPLREAMNVLADQGLLFYRPNQGYFVTKRAPAEHAQIRRVLHLLEHELALSLAWPNDRVLAALNDLNFQIKTCVARADVPGLIKLNQEFHFLVFSLSPNGHDIRRGPPPLVDDRAVAAQQVRPTRRTRTYGSGARSHDLSPGQRGPSSVYG